MLFWLIYISLFSKKEFDQKELIHAEYIFTPILKQLSSRLFNKLQMTLRPDIRLLIAQNTSSIFRYYTLQSKYTTIQSINNSLIFNSYSSDELIPLYFMDKESLSLFDCVQNKVFYTNSLLDISYLDVLIDVYNKIKHSSFNLVYYEIQISTIDLFNYKEIICNLNGIGRIHNTIYREKCFILEKLINHFKKFCKESVLINKRHIDIVEDYTISIFNILLKYNIFTNNTFSSDIIPYLFPFKMVSDMFGVFTNKLIMTGGVCLEEAYVNKKEMKGRFIFTCVMEVVDNEIRLVFFE